MLICFDASTEAKKALDAILETGHFRHISEAVSMALVNYNVLHHIVGNAGQVFPAAAPSQASGPAETECTEPSRQPSQNTTARTNATDTGQTHAIPETFALKATSAERINLLQPAPVSQPGATNLPPA